MKTREIVLGAVIFVAFILALYYIQLNVEQQKETKPAKKQKPKLVPIEDLQEDDDTEEDDDEEEEPNNEE